MNANEFDRFLKTSVKELDKKQEHLRKVKGMGKVDNFEVDLQNDEIVFFRGDTAHARSKILMLGTHIEEQNDWLWAWANSGLSKPIRKRSEKLKELAKLTGQKNLAAPNLDVDGEETWQLVAMACKHLGALGAYAFPNGDARIYVLMLELELLGKGGPAKPATKKTEKPPTRKTAKKSKATTKKSAKKSATKKSAKKKSAKKTPKRRSR